MNAELVVEIAEGAMSAVDLPLRRSQALNGADAEGMPFVECKITHDVNGGHLLGTVRMFEDGKVKVTSPRGLEGLNQEFAARVQIGLIAARHKLKGEKAVERELIGD